MFDEQEPPDRYTVGSVAKALRLVDLVADGPLEGLTLTEIARSLGTSKSTALALARTLANHGYLRAVEPGPHYQLGLTLLRLGDATANRLPLGAACLPILQELTERSGLTTRVAVNENWRPVFVERVDAPSVIRFHTPLGIPEPPHVSSAGKAILATLSDSQVASVVASTGLVRRTPKTITTLEGLLVDLAAVRVRGYAIDDEEDAEGVYCVGAAIRDHFGACVGAISATGLKRDLSPQAVEELGQALVQAAAAASRLLGGGSTSGRSTP